MSPDSFYASREQYLWEESPNLEGRFISPGEVGIVVYDDDGEDHHEDKDEGEDEELVRLEGRFGTFKLQQINID